MLIYKVQTPNKAENWFGLQELGPDEGIRRKRGSLYLVKLLRLTAKRFAAYGCSRILGNQTAEIYNSASSMKAIQSSTVLALST